MSLTNQISRKIVSCACAVNRLDTITPPHTAKLGGVSLLDLILYPQVVC